MARLYRSAWMSARPGCRPHQTFGCVSTAVGLSRRPWARRAARLIHQHRRGRWSGASSRTRGTCAVWNSTVSRSHGPAWGQGGGRGPALSTGLARLAAAVGWVAEPARSAGRGRRLEVSPARPSRALASLLALAGCTGLCGNMRNQPVGSTNMRFLMFGIAGLAFAAQPALAQQPSGPYPTSAVSQQTEPGRYWVFRSRSRDPGGR
jgi:hypothetical protein